MGKETLWGANADAAVINGAAAKRAPPPALGPPEAFFLDLPNKQPLTFESSPIMRREPDDTRQIDNTLQKRGSDDINVKRFPRRYLYS